MILGEDEETWEATTRKAWNRTADAWDPETLDFKKNGVCAVCSESIHLLQGSTWIHNHGHIYCGTGDGATAIPR